MRLLKDQEGYRVEDSDELLDLEEEIRESMVSGAESVGILELDALIKMPMPEVDPVEEAEKEFCWQATVRMRAYKQSKSEVESEDEMYEDLKPVLVQEVELEREIEEVDLTGPSGANAS